MQVMDLQHFFGYVFFLLFIFLIILNFPVALIMHLLMPRAVLEKYFKPPYFSEAEVAFFTGLPFCMIRTVMFMTIFGFPHRGKKRGLTQAYLMVPPWYQRLSKIYMISFVSAMAVVASIGLGFGIYYTYTGQMEW